MTRYEPVLRLYKAKEFPGVEAYWAIGTGPNDQTLPPLGPKYPKEAVPAESV